MKIFLTKRAEKTFRTIKVYIGAKWGEKVAQAFEQKTIDFLDLLEDFQDIGSIEVLEKEIRAFQLTRQTKIFYRIKKDRIIILTFFDVRQDTRKKPR